VGDLVEGEKKGVGQGIMGNVQRLGGVVRSLNESKVTGHGKEEENLQRGALDGIGKEREGGWKKASVRKKRKKETFGFWAKSIKEKNFFVEAGGVSR